MSGSIISTGILTNGGANLLDLERIMDLRIKDITIQIIPLSSNKNVKFMRAVGRLFQFFLHPMLTPTFCHVAIQLNMENNKDIIILEYGQYLSEDSEIKTTTILGSGSKSSDYPRIKTDGAAYWYINKDGARITKINNKHFFGQDDLSKFTRADINYVALKVAASFHHEIPYHEMNQHIQDYMDDYYSIDCNIKEKMTLRELSNHLKDERWKAKNYCVLSNNCQEFAAEVIRVLKAVRTDENTKVRTVEKMILPNKLISSLWNNEDWSLANTIGRIPLIGLLYDLIILK